MTALHIDVATLSAEKLAQLAQMGLITFDAPTQPVTQAHDASATAEPVDEIVNHKGLQCSDANHPHTWTPFRLSNTAVRGANRTDTLEAIARKFDGVNPIVLLEDREIKDESADHPVYHATKGKGKARLIAAIEWLQQHANVTPKTATVLPSSNGAKLAKLQADKRAILAEIEQAKKLRDTYPAMADMVNKRIAELTDQGDSIQADIDDMQGKANGNTSPYAAIVGVTPQAERKVKQTATVAAMGRVNPKAFDENASFVLRRPSVLQSRYKVAKANAATIRTMVAERDEYLKIAADKDTKKAVRETFDAQLDALQEKVGYFSRVTEPGSIDRYQAYVYGLTGDILPHPIYGTKPDVDKLEEKFVELNREPGKTQKSNNAKKAAKTRRKNRK